MLHLELFEKGDEMERVCSTRMRKGYEMLVQKGELGRQSVHGI
jgi:hypothetical protein